METPSYKEEELIKVLDKGLQKRAHNLSEILLDLTEDIDTWDDYTISFLQKAENNDGSINRVAITRPDQRNFIIIPDPDNENTYKIYNRNALNEQNLLETITMNGGGRRAESKLGKHILKFISKYDKQNAKRQNIVKKFEKPEGGKDPKVEGISRKF